MVPSAHDRSAVECAHVTYHAILFDLDGTLVDHYQAVNDAVVRWSAHGGIEPDINRWFELEKYWFSVYERGEISLAEQRRERIRHYLHQAQCPDGRADELFQDFLRLYSDAIRPYPDALDALERALATGATVGILTNGSLAVQRQKLQRAGLDLPGVHLLASEDLGFAKPDPRCYQAALDRLGVSAAGTIMVGDNYTNDVQGPVACGMIARHLDRRRGQTLDHYPPPAPELVVCDMDGTLLDAHGKVPEHFPTMVEHMNELGVTFVPASGRQRQTLALMFPYAKTLIAENGNVLVHNGEVVHSTTLDPAFVRSIIDAARATAAHASLVLCTADSAYVEDDSDEFLAEVDKYYAARTVVEDLRQVDAPCVKIAIFAFDGSESYPLPELGPDHVGTISSPNWIDIMDATMNKGVALARLQEVLGVPMERTAVFGDYLNDVEMLSRAEMSFAMDNAHPILASTARWRAPSNAHHGVITALQCLL